MEKRINPLPQIIGDEPEATGGNFLDGLMHQIHRSSGENALEKIGPDNFRGVKEEKDQGADNFRGKPKETKTSNTGNK